MTMTSANSTSTRKKYEDELAIQKTAAEQDSAAYAEKQNAATDAYKQAVDTQTADTIAAQRQAAARQQKQTAQSYNAVFDQNRAEQLAAEENLREQMAQAGLTRSGYNATNQTALQIARQNADAGARNARQQAVDAILQNLAAYEAEARLQADSAKAQADRAAQQNIMDNWAAGQQAAGTNAINWLNYDASQAAAAQDQANALRDAVDAHNSDINSKMLAAYEMGDYALAQQLWNDRWAIDENGNIVTVGGDLSAAIADSRAADAAAAEAAAQQTAFENNLAIDKQDLAWSQLRSDNANADADRDVELYKIDTNDAFNRDKLRSDSANAAADRKVKLTQISKSNDEETWYPEEYGATISRIKDYLESGETGDVTKAYDELYKLVRDGGTEIDEAALRNICVNTGMSYNLLAYCIGTKQLPSSADLNDFSM